MSTIDANINKLFDFANTALRDARSAAGRVNTFVPNVASGKLDYDVRTPGMTKPAALTDLLQIDNSGGTLNFLNAETEALIDRHFPEINGCLRYSPEQWLCGILTGQKPFGLSNDVFTAVWHEGRDRAYRESSSAVAQIRAEFSSRGFKSPPGAMFKAVIQAEERASDAISEVNRLQMIRDSEIKDDLLKFAEDQAIRLKLGIFQSITDYYRVLMELPSKDIEASRMKVAAYTSLNDSLSQYYRVQLGFEELRLQAENLRVNGRLEESRLRISALDGSRNAALAQISQAFAGVGESAAAAASTLNANIITG